MTSDEIKARYKQMKEDDHPVQTCRVCKEKGMKKEMEPHHPKGRRGMNLLIYKWVHPLCHRGVHDNPKAATKHGWLVAGRNTK